MKNRHFEILKDVLLPLFLMILFFSDLTAQDYVRTGGLRIETDLAAFRRVEDWTRLECYFSMPRYDLDHQKTANGFEAIVHSRIQVYHLDSLIAEDVIQSVDVADSAHEIRRGQMITNQSSFLLKPGKYSLILSVSGPLPQNSGQVKQAVTIEPYGRDSLIISDIELALYMAPDTARTRFYKNGLSVIPNPPGIYADAWPVLYYYAEIYNLSTVKSASDSTLTVNWAIHDANGMRIKSSNPKQRRRKYQSVVEAGRIRVDSLARGSYTLSLQVREGADGPSAERTKHFFVHHPPDSLKSAAAGPAAVIYADIYASMNEADLDRHFRQAAYIATMDEKKMYAGLKLSGKRAFLRMFWDRRDQRPDTDANEYQAAYYQKVMEADKRFGSGKRKGWEADRGRIFILYGTPDEIERFPSNIGVRAYQTWHYHTLEGGVIFIFVDKRNLGDMTLVHSTKRNEINDTQWKRWLH